MLRSLAFLFIAVLATLAAHDARTVRADESSPAASTDPIEWAEPKQAPQFREVLKEKDYKPRFDKAAARIDVASLEKGNHATAGMLVVRVNPGSPADASGVRVGDLLTHIDGQQLWNVMRRSTDRGQVFTFIRKDGGQIAVGVGPGDFGIVTRFEWHPEFEYLKSKSRDPRWDKQVLVAIAARSTDPYLAETALHHAVAAGLLPNRMIEGVGAEIALEQGRNEAALDFVWSALVQNKTVGQLELNPTILYRVAIANYKLDVAAEILDDYPGVAGSDSDLRRLAKAHRSSTQAERFQPLPEQLAATMRHGDLIARMSPIDEQSAKSFKNLLTKDTPFKFNLAAGQSSAVTYKPEPAVHDMEVVLKFTARSADGVQTDHPSELELAVVDLAKPREASRPADEVADPRQLSITFNSDRSDPTGASLEMVHSGLAGTNLRFDSPSALLDGAQVNELRFLRIGGQGELFLNGRRMLYIPIDPRIVDLGFRFKVDGMNAEFKEARFDELLPKP